MFGDPECVSQHISCSHWLHASHKVEGLVHCGVAQVLIKRWMNRSKDRNNQSVLGAFHMCNAPCPPGEGHRLMNGPISQINRGRKDGSWIVSKNVLLA